MGADPLKAMGGWRAGEGAIEITAPLVATGAVWAVVFNLLSRPAVGRGVTWVELTVLLGAACAVTGWMAGRQLFMARKRNPWTIALVSLIYSGVIVAVVANRVPASFASYCTQALEGIMVASTPLMGVDPGDILAEGPEVCKLGGVRNNPYLPGAILRPGRGPCTRCSSCSWAWSRPWQPWAPGTAASWARTSARS